MLDLESRTLRTAGAAYMFFGLLSVAVGLFGFFAEPGTLNLPPAGLAIVAVIGLFQTIAGYCLRRCQTWAWWSCMVLSGLGLLGFPIGTIIHGLLLRALYKGKDALLHGAQAAYMDEGQGRMNMDDGRGVYPYQGNAQPETPAQPQIRVQPMMDDASNPYSMNR